MPRALREKMVPWAGASVAVASLAAVLPGAMMMPNLDLGLDTQLMAMTVAWVVLHLLRDVLGPMRRYSGHWFVQNGFKAAYYLRLPLALYAANSVRYSSDLRAYHVMWGSTLPLFSFLLELMSGPMHSAYTLGDGPFRGWRFLSAIYSWFSVCSLLVSSKLEPEKERPSAILMTIVFCSAIGLSGVLLVVLPSTWSDVTSTLVHDAKIYADWMKEEVSRPFSPFFDGNTNNNRLNGCEYPISIVRRGEQLVIKRMNDVSSNITMDDGDGTVQDILLSYIFSQMLARRYFGFDCAEEGNTKVRDFALKVLMQPPDYERAFAIAEVQLAFLHDEYFIALATWERRPAAHKSWSPVFLIITSSVSATLPFLTSLGAPQTESHAFPHWFHFISFLVILIWGSALLWWMWEATDSRMTWEVLGTGTLPPWSNNSFNRRPYWKNKIGQYSLIQDYDSYSAKKISLFLLKTIILSDWPPTFIKHHPVEKAAVPLPGSVRKLVARTLRAINGPPTNGIRALQRNRDRIMRTIMEDDLSWTCNQETHTHTILIWHIATCYMLPPDSYLPSNLRLVETREYYEVATALSRYCAYLVAFLPDFLPVNKLTTQMVFQDVVQQAKGVLQSTGLSLDDKRAKMRELGGLPDGDGLGVLTTFQKGVKLGQQLDRLDTLLRCKVMAEFWAETILYIAPSDKAALHFEHLAQGGEFVTHLWAVLSNAGILKRASEKEMNLQQPDPAAPVTSE